MAFQFVWGILYKQGRQPVRRGKKKTTKGFDSKTNSANKNVGYTKYKFKRQTVPRNKMCIYVQEKVSFIYKTCIQVNKN